MIIRNTDVEATCPWPDGMFVQGGAHGVVLGPKPYRTAFVEALTPKPLSTFIRGEGSTIAEAERACWAQYERVMACDGTGEPHGPFEPRHYENGAGFCARCGAWFSKVCEPSIDYKIDALAGQRLRARHGDGWHALRGPMWDALRDHEEALIRHELGIGPEPGPAPELTEQDRERLAAGNRVHTEDVDPADLIKAWAVTQAMLSGLAASLPEKGERDG
jgi:hypothetical protein